MKCECVKCNGNGEIECEHCGSSRGCYTCDGTGHVIECISTVTLPPKLKNLDQIEALQADARKCIADHERLIHMNPPAKASYDRQLSETLSKLESEAEVLRNS